MAYQKLNSIEMKEQNKRVLLREIRKNNEVSRRQLAKLTGLTGASITNLVSELIEQQMVLESRQGPSVGGRKPTLLQINPAAGYMIGVELSSSEMIGVLTDFSPNSLDQFCHKVDFNKSPNIIISEIAAAVENLITQNQIDKNQIFGVGIASAGPYDRSLNLMVNPPNFKGWHMVPLIQNLQSALDLPVFFEKETAAIALGEYLFGKHNGYKRLMAVNVYEKGIGGSLLIDGEIYHGNDNSSMEIGHISVDPKGAPCPCGGRGCLEVQADGEAALRYAHKNRANLPTSSSMQDLCKAFAKGDPFATGAIEKCAVYLGDALGNLATLLSPDILYLDGPFVEMCPELFTLAIAKMHEKPYPNNIQSIQKAKFSFGKFSGAVGAVAIVYASLFH